MSKAKAKKEVTRVVRYMISGGAHFWSGYLVFFVADKGLGWSLWWAKLAANVIGWTVNYMLQRYWVFNNPNLAKNQLVVTERYVLLVASNFLLDYVIVASLKTAGLTPYIGQFVSAGFFTVWNYFWYRFWVFPERFAKRRHL